MQSLLPSRWVLWTSLGIGAVLLALIAWSRFNKSAKSIAQKTAIALAEATHNHAIKSLQHKIEILKDSEERDQEAIAKLNMEIAFRRSRLREVYEAADVDTAEIKRRLEALRFKYR